jgi:spermidine/putrescine transport system substrate-binding protein
MLRDPPDTEPARQRAQLSGWKRLSIGLVAWLLAAVPLSADESLVLYNWADYFPPDLLDRFHAETGIRVVTEIFETNEAMLANVEAGVGHYDVIVPSDYMVKIMIDRGLLRDIEASGMENFRHVKPPFDDVWYDPGRRYSVPNMQGTSGFFYDSGQVEGGKLDESWSEFFDPRPEVIGKVVALDDPRELYQAAAYFLGINPCTEDPDEAQRILDLLVEQKPKLAYYTSGTNPTLEDPLQAAIDAMMSREVALSQGWDGGARFLKRVQPGIVYVIPVEGAALWQDAYVVPHDAWNPENALVFLNWIMRPENIAAVSNFNGYTNSIAGSEAYMEPALAADQVTGFSPGVRERLRPVEVCSNAAIELNGRVWSRLWPRSVK